MFCSQFSVTLSPEMESIQNIVEFSQWPLLTAFVLGILVALHPCPMATNIAAMGYIGKDVENRRQVFVDGLLYTLGRTISYSVLGAVLIALIRGGAAHPGTAAHCDRPLSAL